MGKKQKQKPPGLAKRIKTGVKVADHYMNEVLLVSSPDLAENPLEFIRSIYRTIKQSLISGKRPTLAALLQMDLDPKVTIEDFEHEVESLFIAVDRDGNQSLDMKELRFFTRQFVHMCNKKVKNLEDEEFTHFILDDEKLKALEEWPQTVELEKRRRKQKRKQERLRKKAMEREDYSSQEEIHSAAGDQIIDAAGVDEFAEGGEAERSRKTKKKDKNEGPTVRLKEIQAYLRKLFLMKTKKQSGEQEYNQWISQAKEIPGQKRTSRNWAFSDGKFDTFKWMELKQKFKNDAKWLEQDWTRRQDLAFTDQFE